ncbi:hypothetical protein [Haliangium sp.]|uniref:hypothetical protein n=1 Tax=Haliangium sp. TaxID=2663208 RepID=UPI003D0A9397
MQRQSALCIGVVGALAGVLASCALGGDEGGVDGPDAGPSADCIMRIVVATESPRAPDDIVLTATVESRELTGFRSYQWDVTSDGDPVALNELTADGAQVAFYALTPGPYRVLLAGSIGGYTCVPDTATINVADPNADAVEYRLRLVPRAGQPAPVQERALSLVPGLDFELDTVSVSGGLSVDGLVRKDGGSPLAGYVRATPVGASVPWLIEGFAGDDGAFSLRLEAGLYDLLVVPTDGSVAPVRFSDLAADAAWELSVRPGIDIDGVVTGPAQTPLGDAQVTLTVDGVPSTLAGTGADGAFTLSTRPGTEATLAVIPAADSGLPWLTLPASGALADSLGNGAPPLAVTYADQLSSRQVTATALAADGVTPLAGVRATWTARPLAGAATLTAGGDPIALTGSAHLSATSDDSGAWPRLDLPVAPDGGIYDVVLEPADDALGVTLLEVDLSAGTPSELALVAPAQVAGRTLDSVRDPAPGVRVSATPLGTLAQSTGAGATAVTAADGRFSLALTAGGAYELRFDSPDPALGSARHIVTAPGPGEGLDLGALELPAAFRVSGRAVFTGGAGGAAGVTVQLLCLACAPPDSDRPLAEAVTDITGGFTLRVPIGGAIAAGVGPATRP